MATDSSFAAENSSCHRASEGQDIEVAAAGSRKLPSSKFKGVVAQPNGRWGAQIYENNQRVWLGTFTEEEEAAKAYDIAALRFRGQNAFTNFRSSMDHHANNEDNGFEKFFLLSHSKEEIVDMIRKHTYRDELERSKYNYACYNDTTNRNISGNGFPGLPGFDPSYHGAFEHLFQKIVTPSDVGRLNRIVIPKQHADKHFPTETRIAAKGVLLNFEDKMGKVWRFRYCYWKSSQSYVLTKGWTKFVKEKSLKAGDVVSFWRSMGQNPKFFIDHKAGSEPNFDQEVQNRAVHCRANMGTVRLFGVNI